MKATEVQGASKEVGAKVIYQGREMTVSKGIDSDGELKMADYSGVIAFAEMLKSNSSLRELKYTTCRHFPTIVGSPLMRLAINVSAQ